MSCGCNNNNRSFKVCKACRLLDNDTSPKWCRWCAVCQAWLCERCEKDFLRRTRAFGKNIMNKLYGKDTGN